MLWVLSLQRDSSIQSQNLCETESFPLQNLSCKCKDWIFGDLGATKQPKKKQLLNAKTLCYSIEREIPGFAKWVFGEEEEGSDEESIGD